MSALPQPEPRAAAEPKQAAAEVLAGTEWLGATRRFAGALRGSVVPHGGGLLLVGTPEYEPWHLAAHLVDEAAWSGTPELALDLQSVTVGGNTYYVSTEDLQQAGLEELGKKWG